MRTGIPKPTSRVILPPGNLLIPDGNIAVAVVVASATVLTLFDTKLKKGGIGHFVRPRPEKGEKPTAIFGLPACIALIGEFIKLGSDIENIQAGIYGGAFPDWANAEQRKLSRENVDVVRDVMSKKNIKIIDEDVGGFRGRKIVYLTSSNDIAVVKTDAVRDTDWYPQLPLREK